MKNKIIWIRSNEGDFDDPFGDITEKRTHSKIKNHDYFEKKNSRVIFDTQNFKCRQCGYFVTAGRDVAGVNNRNHCPRCLWSRHMDLSTPGDRKSDCLSRMEPVGLTCKQVNKRYGYTNQGELMVIHHCTGCGKLSINRIAADDDATAIYHLYLDSGSICLELKKLIEKEGVSILSNDDLPTVRAQLFGRPIESGEFHPENA